jgi:hypothetical protein
MDSIKNLNTNIEDIKLKIKFEEINKYIKKLNKRNIINNIISKISKRINDINQAIDNINNNKYNKNPINYQFDDIFWLGVDLDSFDEYIYKTFENN